MCHFLGHPVYGILLMVFLKRFADHDVLAWVVREACLMAVKQLVCSC